MKSISSDLLTHIQSECTTLATCWKVTRTDGELFGYTDHDQDIVYGGITYIAASGYMPTAISTTAALNVDNLDLDGMLDNDNITEDDILAGLWDYADIEIFEVNYSDLTQGANPLRKGTLGNVSLKRSMYTAELRGMTQPLQQTVGKLFIAPCDADLGDARCGLYLPTYTVSGAIGAISNQRGWLDSALTQAAGYFTGGMVTWLTGLNAGLQMEVKTYTVGSVLLQLPMPYPLAIGDTYTISAGCDKARATCRDRFSNVDNFRGCPDIPGNDATIRGHD